MQPISDAYSGWSYVEDIKIYLVWTRMRQWVGNMEAHNVIMVMDLRKTYHPTIKAHILTLQNNYFS